MKFNPNLCRKSSFDPLPTKGASFCRNDEKKLRRIQSFPEMPSDLVRFPSPMRPETKRRRKIEVQAKKPIVQEKHFSFEVKTEHYQRTVSVKTKQEEQIVRRKSTENEEDETFDRRPLLNLIEDFHQRQLTANSIIPPKTFPTFSPNLRPPTRRVSPLPFASSPQPIGKLAVPEETAEEKKSATARRISVLRSHTFNMSTDVDEQMKPSEPLISQSTPQLNSAPTLIDQHQHNSTTNLHLEEKNEVIIINQKNEKKNENENENKNERKSFSFLPLRRFSLSPLMLSGCRDVSLFIAKITNRSEKINISLLRSLISNLKQILMSDQRSASAAAAPSATLIRSSTPILHSNSNIYAVRRHHFRPAERNSIATGSPSPLPSSPLVWCIEVIVVSLRPNAKPLPCRCTTTEKSYVEALKNLVTVSPLYLYLFIARRTISLCFPSEILFADEGQNGDSERSAERYLLQNSGNPHSSHSKNLFFPWKCSLSFVVPGFSHLDLPEIISMG